MASQHPTPELDRRYSSEDATSPPWSEVSSALERAEVFWLTTVRPDGRPHVTPLICVWLDEVLYFCTGAGERKAKNLAGNAHVALTTGRNSLSEGVDLVVEGDAIRLGVGDEPLLQRVADAYEAKYGGDWRFTVREGALHGAGGPALAFQVAPATIFGFGKGRYSQTRWTFAAIANRRPPLQPR